MRIKCFFRLNPHFSYMINHYYPHLFFYLFTQIFIIYSSLNEKSSERIWKSECTEGIQSKHKLVKGSETSLCNLRNIHLKNPATIFLLYFMLSKHGKSKSILPQSFKNNKNKSSFIYFNPLIFNSICMWYLSPLLRLPSCVAPVWKLDI